jgi:diguanylate cyclase (GGDEF)-like protein/PAS domain S-box-containing protein
MHRLLARQLRKLGLAPQQPADALQWQALLTLIDKTYQEEDQSRYTLERANAISADEISHDVSKLNQKLSSQEAHLRTIFSTLNELIWLKDTQGIYLTCNPKFERFIGLEESYLIGKTDRDITDPEFSGFLKKLNADMPELNRPQVYEEWFEIGPDRQLVLLEIILTPVFNGSELLGVLGLGRDITERRLAANRIKNLAYFDTLTGLPNRTLVRDRLDQAMVSSARSSKHGAVLFIDLDHFKMLNDTLGHDMGDLLLKQVANLLTVCVRKSDTVARIGGDEFVVVLTDLSRDQEQAAAEIEAVGNKIISAFKQPFLINELNHRSTPSIGAVLFQGLETDVDTLLKQADLAMYKSKESGRNAFCFFDPSLERAVNFRVQMESDLRQAILEKQFLLHFQAQVTHTGKITGSEVLIRWLQPERGLVPPAEFIPTAEATGLIVPIGHWVLEQACEQLVAWANQPGLEHLTISVNVSALQFRQPDFLEEILNILRVSGADPLKLKLELTESLLVSNVEEIIFKMQQLKSHGIGLSLDDFGTGYSSFTYLKRMPLEQLKIDRSFVHDMLNNSADASIVKTIVDLTKNLNLVVIAEGVENVRQRDFLRQIGCEHFQGYFHSKPLPLDQFEACALSSFQPVVS